MAGYDCCVAEDGIEALMMLADVCPEVAIVDIGLPDTDGHELARHVPPGPKVLWRISVLTIGERRCLNSFT
jgi:DNA-binding response OmpR family regulator